jgi:hypothetical protein
MEPAGWRFFVAWNDMESAGADQVTSGVDEER